MVASVKLEIACWSYDYDVPALAESLGVLTVRSGTAKAALPDGRHQSWVNLAEETWSAVGTLDVAQVLDVHMQRLQSTVRSFHLQGVGVVVIVQGTFFPDLRLTFRPDLWSWLVELEGSLELDLLATRDTSWPYIVSFPHDGYGAVVRVEIHGLLDQHKHFIDSFTFLEKKFYAASDEYQDLGDKALLPMLSAMANQSPGYNVSRGLIRVLDRPPFSSAGLRVEKDLCATLAMGTWTLEVDIVSSPSRE